jgi:hypothetical protein
MQLSVPEDVMMKLSREIIMHPLISDFTFYHEITELIYRFCNWMKSDKGTEIRGFLQELLISTGEEKISFSESSSNFFLLYDTHRRFSL